MSCNRAEAKKKSALGYSQHDDVKIYANVFCIFVPCFPSTNTTEFGLHFWFQIRSTGAFAKKQAQVQKIIHHLQCGHWLK